MDEVMAFVATTDAARARRFYEEVLRLQFVEDTPFALVFQSGATTVRVQKVKEFQPHPFTALGWKVRDMTAAVQDLASRGVELLRFAFLQQDERGVWQAPDGAQVAWFHDPDGNTLSLAQLP
jgi:catechol 2,3-dioxygenase-like lactoylglutathione lyase family enzyme